MFDLTCTTTLVRNKDGGSQQTLGSKQLITLSRFPSPASLKLNTQPPDPYYPISIYLGQIQIIFNKTPKRSLFIRINLRAILLAVAALCFYIEPIIILASILHICNVDDYRFRLRVCKNKRIYATFSCSRGIGSDPVTYNFPMPQFHFLYRFHSLSFHPCGKWWLAQAFGNMYPCGVGRQTGNRMLRTKGSSGHFDDAYSPILILPPFGQRRDEPVINLESKSHFLIHICRHLQAPHHASHPCE